MDNQSSPSTAEQVTPILMPQAGNTMDEGTVLVWLAREGDRIEVGQAICEIETDKATIEYESPAAGRLARIVAGPDKPVDVQELIAVLAENDAAADAYLKSSGQRNPASARTESSQILSEANRKESNCASPAVNTERAPVSPAARKIAAQRGISLASIPSGSGVRGRILSTDVDAAAECVGPAQNANTQRRTLSNMRRAIALNLQQSKQSIPHFYVQTTIGAKPLLDFYRDQKEKAHCTLNDIFVLAVGRAIAEFPAVRSQIRETELIEFPHSNIGIAIGVEEGLVVPVVLKVETLSLGQLAAETRRIVADARNGRLQSAGRGVFTISNLGMFGVDEFSAIINPPESGILAVGAVRETVIVEGGALRPGHAVTMTLSADHRVLDGIIAAQFLARLKEILVRPAEELS